MRGEIVQLTTRKADAGLVIRIEETRIDAAVAIEFKEAVRNAAQRGGNPVILDLSQVTFLDSSGLGAVVAVMKLLAPERTLELAGLTPGVARVFRLTRMDSVFTIHPGAPAETDQPLKVAG